MRFLRRILGEFLDDDCPALAAALSYYTVFSLAPLLVVVISVAGLIFGEQTVRAAIQQQIDNIIGGGAAQQVSTMVQYANEQSRTGSIIGTILGIAVLLFGATSAFAQLQSALNRAWEVAPDPAQGGIRNFMSKRVMSLGMVLGIAFLLLVSLIISAALAATGDWIGDVLPFSAELLWILNTGVSLAVTAVLFGAMFKVLPDAVIAWKDVWVGAIVTSLLFAAGKFGLAYYIGKASPASGYGAAGSVILIFLWIYYASMILLLGAEFTQVWAESQGSGISPEKGAIRVQRPKVEMRGEPRQQQRPAA